jgi:ribosomal protein S18 acetylase RimI-like enzyme
MAIPEPLALTTDRCDPAEEKNILALAAQAWSEPERPAFWQAIAAMIRSGQADRVVLLAARRHGEPIAAQLAQAMPGRVAVVWPPQFQIADEPSRENVAALLFDRLMRELSGCDVHLAQALLTHDNRAAANQFAAGGFSHAADLLYLAAEAGSQQSAPALSFDIETFAPAAESRLARLVERTYVGTLDCPIIDGLRKTPDVIAGYQAVGEFRAALWHIARDGARDIGCLLLNVHPDVQHAEIVYLGLIPEVRGRRWGQQLIEFARWLARQANCDRVVLAVDAANHPAIRLYKAAGFFEFDRRAVWIRPLS